MHQGASLVAQRIKSLPACSAGDPGLIPGSGRSSGEGNGNPLQYSFPGKSHGHRSLVAYSPWGHKELDTTERLHLDCNDFLAHIFWWSYEYIFVGYISKRELPVHGIGISSSLVNTAQQFISNLFFNLKWIRYPVPSSTLDFFPSFLFSYCSGSPSWFYLKSPYI